MSDQALQEVAGDGANTAITKEMLDILKQEVADIRTELSVYVNQRRDDSENTRYCLWPGQSPDGRKRKSHLLKDPQPFEGASDNRVRVADQIINEQVLEITAAALKVQPKIIGMQGQDETQAAKLSTLLRWVRKQWGSDWRRQIKLLANFMLGDTPAGAVAYVDWISESGLEYRIITSEEAHALLLTSPNSPFAQMADSVGIEFSVAEATDLLSNPAREEELANTLSLVMVGVSTRRLKKIARDLQRSGEAEYPQPYDKVSIPCIQALRLFDDVFFPANTTDLQRARCIFYRRWYSKAECIERAAIEGWSDDFINNLIYGPHGKDGNGCEGQSAFDDLTISQVVEDGFSQCDERKAQYEVIRCYQQASNDDGVKSWYVYTFSCFVDVPAKERELWDRKHGRAPFVYFSRETLRARLIDSRGISELASTDQAGLKLLKDSFEDHVQSTINPPIRKPRGRPFYTTSLAPFGQIDADPRDNIGFLERPSYPQAADKYWREMRRGLNEYWGRLDNETQPNETLALLHSQGRVDDFLASLSDCLVMVVQLCQQYMTDTQIQRIVGGSGLPIARTVDEIQGAYDIQLTYDIRDLTMENVVQKAKVVLENIRPLDIRGIVPYDHFLRQVVAAVDPSWADIIPPAEVADQRVVGEEQDNFVKILNGVEPQMPERIDNPALRLQTLQTSMQPRMQNPGAFAPLQPASQAILQNRIKYLQFQAQQNENAQTGRIGTEPLTPDNLGVQEEQT